MENFKIAAQLYTMRELLNQKTDEEVYAALKAVKDIGYEAVQISGIGPIDEEKAKLYQRICQELELEICATHLGLDQLETDLDWVIAYHQLWQCAYVGIGAMPDKYRGSAQGYIDFAKICNQIGKKLLDQGIHLVYHNHKFEFERYENQIGMDILFEHFDPQFVEFELDTYWVQAGGANPVDWIYKVDGRMGVVHFKDFRIVKDEQQFAEVGSGNLNWPAIIEACQKTKVRYAAVEQDSFTQDPLKSLAQSYRFLV